MSPGRFRIEFERKTLRELESLEKEDRLNILEEIQRYLSDTPYRPIKTRIKRMSGFSPTLYRLRVGDFRVYYRTREQTVVVLAVLHKKDATKWLKGR